MDGRVFLRLPMLQNPRPSLALALIVSHLVIQIQPSCGQAYQQGIVEIAARTPRGKASQHPGSLPHRVEWPPAPRDAACGQSITIWKDSRRKRDATENATPTPGIPKTCRSHGTRDARTGACRIGSDVWFRSHVRWGGKIPPKRWTRPLMNQTSCARCYPKRSRRPKGRQRPRMRLDSMARPADLDRRPRPVPLPFAICPLPFGLFFALLPGPLPKFARKASLRRRTTRHLRAVVQLGRRRPGRKRAEPGVLRLRVSD